jgi:hypothetical protein
MRGKYTREAPPHRANFCPVPSPGLWVQSGTSPRCLVGSRDTPTHAPACPAAPALQRSHAAPARDEVVTVCGSPMESSHTDTIVGVLAPRSSFPSRVGNALGVLGVPGPLGRDACRSASAEMQDAVLPRLPFAQREKISRRSPADTRCAAQGVLPTRARPRVVSAVASPGPCRSRCDATNSPGALPGSRRVRMIRVWTPRG